MIRHSVILELFDIVPLNSPMAWDTVVYGYRQPHVREQHDSTPRVLGSVSQLPGTDRDFRRRDCKLHQQQQLNTNNNKNDDFYSAVTWRKAITRALKYAKR